MANLASVLWYQGRWKEAEGLEVHVMETKMRLLGTDHPDTLTSMANLATTYMSQGWRSVTTDLQIEAVNQLRTTLGEGHPSTGVAIANLASFREERTAPAPLCGNYNNESGAFQATSAEPDEGNETDEELLQRALAILIMDKNDCEELVATENIYGRPIMVAGSIYSLVADMRRQIASRS